MVLRTAVPTIYVLFLAEVEHLAGTGCAGLISTFPSMSLVVLVVTHLEAGPAQSSRIALVLPMANTSTAAFLVAFRLTCPVLGLSSGDGRRLCGRPHHLAGRRSASRVVRVSSGRPPARRRRWPHEGIHWSVAARVGSATGDAADAHRRSRPTHIERSRSQEGAPSRSFLAAGRKLGMVRGSVPWSQSPHRRWRWPARDSSLVLLERSTGRSRADDRPPDITDSTH